MYTVRFNPAINQWVLLGEPLAREVTIGPGHLINSQSGSQLLAANYPGHPFLLHPSSPVGKATQEELLVEGHQAVGEYELILYTGDTDLLKWKAKEWEQWLSFISERIVQLHHNVHLHFLTFVLSTKARHTVVGYQRVGDLIATSHQISGIDAVLEQELVSKLQKRERLFMVAEQVHGTVYVPSAPTHLKEIWYLPVHGGPSIHASTTEERQALAQDLATIFSCLTKEFSKERFVLRIHTAMHGMSPEASWWVQIYQEDTLLEGPVPVLPSPERFVFLMRKLVAHARVTAK